VQTGRDPAGVVGCASGSLGLRTRTSYCERSSSGWSVSTSGWRPNASGWVGRTSGCGPKASGSRRSTSGCVVRWRRCAGRPSARRRRSPRATPRPTPSGRGASPAWPTAPAPIGVRPSTSTRSWRWAGGVLPGLRWRAGRGAGGAAVPGELASTRPLVTGYQVQVGRCQSCGRRVQPRHPGQTSDALGRPPPSLVPGWWRWPRGSARAWACRPARSPGCLATSAFRSPRAGSPRPSPAPRGAASRPTRPWSRGAGQPVVAGAETGWRVGGARACCGRLPVRRSPSTGSPMVVAPPTPRRCWARATPACWNVTAGRRIAAWCMPPTRAAWRTCCGAAASCWPTPTGGRPRPARGAPHPGARAGAAGGPRRRHPGRGHAGRRGRAPGARVDKLVAGATRYPPNRRLLNHLARERAHLFTFLLVSGVQATNWRAEHAIRPAVVTRKTWGGNRTWTGPSPGRRSPAWCAPPASKATTPSSSWRGCCVHPTRSWPTSPSPGADQRHTSPGTPAISIQSTFPSERA
jgi:Transposase IS66 family